MTLDQAYQLFLHARFSESSLISKKTWRPPPRQTSQTYMKTPRSLLANFTITYITTQPMSDPAHAK